MSTHHSLLIKKALELLGVDRFVLAIHDSSFPCSTNEELLRGSPYSVEAGQFLTFLSSLGFNGLQLGPQGATTSVDNSPYSGASFVKNTNSIGAMTLIKNSSLEGLLRPDYLEKIVSSLSSGDRNHTDFNLSSDAIKKILYQVEDRFFDLPPDHSLRKKFDSYKTALAQEKVDWPLREQLYEILTSYYSTDDWRMWRLAKTGTSDWSLFQTYPYSNFTPSVGDTINTLLGKNDQISNRLFMGQFIIDMQHQHFKERAHSLGLKLYGDLQIGYSFRDLWAWNNLFLKGYYMGAPPSRTNPDGQPWGYPLLDPDKYYSSDSQLDGPAARFLIARIKKMFESYDGIRIDHPHGHVCPWVYRNDGDPYKSVRNGARLYSSPDIEGHPDLSNYSIVNKEQLNLELPRYHDDWVRDLTSNQEKHYAVPLDLILNTAEDCGRSKNDLLFEVLSTWPFPLRTVMKKRGFGRFCVTQKTDPNDPNDVYSIKNTVPEDWVMCGNHDTPPLKNVIDQRWDSSWRYDRARLLQKNLNISDETVYTRLVTDKAFFFHSMFAELFVASAKNVSIFFADLFCLEEIYNRPGTVDSRNWTLRVPPDYQHFYKMHLHDGYVLNIMFSLALALRAQFPNDETAKSLANQMANGLK